MDKLQKIKENFESKKYSLREVPCVFVADCSGVYLHKDGRHQDEIDSLEHMNWSRDKIITPKLKVIGHGDYDFDIGLIGTQFFDSHEKLDTLYAHEWRFSEPGDSKPPVKRDKISLEDALNFFPLEMSCNMDYYLANREEMEKDLDRSLDGLDLGDETVLEQLQKELFRNQMIKIFGDGEDGGAIVLTDYHILYNDGNAMFATARRGNHYWIIQHCTS